VDCFAWVALGEGGLGLPVSFVEAWATVLAWVGDVVVAAVDGFGGVDPSPVADDMIAVAAGASAVCV